MKRTLTTHSLEETWDLAARVLGHAAEPCVIALHGELGSGKTAFVQGLARALDVAAPVTSPTFKLVNEYHGKRPLYHLDLYRLTGPDDAYGIGIEDYLEPDGITAIEWADRIAAILPPSTLHLYFEMTEAPDERTITIQAP